MNDEQLADGQPSPYMYEMVQDLGHPCVFPPLVGGQLPAAVQFVIPGLQIGKDKEDWLRLARNCGEVWDAALDPVTSANNQGPATLMTIAFYVPRSTDDSEDDRIPWATAHLLVERYVGLVSFCAGLACSAVHRQVTVQYGPGHFRKVLPNARRTLAPKANFRVPSQLLGSQVPSDAAFSALFWLRRGLAERDPIVTFNSLMVCLQILARDLAISEPKAHKHRNSTVRMEGRRPEITLQVRELVVGKLGASVELFDRLWTARNTVVAHGNVPITVDMLLTLTDLKFEAAILAYKGVKLALDMPMDGVPMPNQAFFDASALVYLD